MKMPIKMPSPLGREDRRELPGPTRPSPIKGRRKSVKVPVRERGRSQAGTVRPLSPLGGEGQGRSEAEHRHRPSPIKGREKSVVRREGEIGKTPL